MNIMHNLLYMMHYDLTRASNRGVYEPYKTILNIKTNFRQHKCTFWKFFYKNIGVSLVNNSRII